MAVKMTEYMTLDLELRTEGSGRSPIGIEETAYHLRALADQLEKLQRAGYRLTDNPLIGLEYALRSNKSSEFQLVRDVPAELPKHLVSELSTVGKRSKRLLAEAGLITLEDVAQRSEDEIRALHVGQAVQNKLRKAMAKLGLKYADTPTPQLVVEP